MEISKLLSPAFEQPSSMESQYARVSPHPNSTPNISPSKTILMRPIDLRLVRCNGDLKQPAASSIYEPSASASGVSNFNNYYYKTTTLPSLHRLCAVASTLPNVVRTPTGTVAVQAQQQVPQHQASVLPPLSSRLSSGSSMAPVPAPAVRRYEERSAGKVKSNCCHRERKAPYNPRGGACIVESCQNKAVSRGRCISHGGGCRCKYPGCPNGAKMHGLCHVHGGKRKCQHPGCTKGAKLKGLCWAHGGNKVCSVKLCSRVGVKNGICRYHYELGIKNAAMAHEISH